MNQKNFEYLRDQIKFTGFGEALEENLKTAIQNGKPEFKLNHYSQYGNDTLTTELSFTRSRQSDMYFFNSYQVDLQKEGVSDKMQQTFYINKGNNITLKEAYNLMSGRAVNKDLTNKEGQLFNAWIQMDFKQSSENGNFKLKHFHQNYGYDLEEALSKHPIRELTHPEFKNNLIESLKKGNLQSATFQKDGQDQKHYIEASPQFKTINVYDGNMQRIDNRQARSEKQSQGESKAIRPDTKKEKQAATDDEGPEPTQAPKRKRRKAQAV